MATLVDVAVASDSGVGVSRTVTLPTGIQSGDVMFFAWATQSTHTLNDLNGATQIGTTQNGGTDTSLSVVYLVADGTEGSTITFTNLFSLSENGGSLCFAYRGLDTADLEEAVSQGQTNGTLIQGPETTTINSQCLVLQILGEDPNGSTYTMTPDVRATEIWDGKTDANDYGYVAVQAYEQEIAGAATLDATMSISATYAHFQIALNNENIASDTVTPPNPLTDGATTQAYSPTGFASGAINSVTLDGVDVPSFTQTTFDNFDIPTIASDAGTLGSKLGTVSFEASNGTETANANTDNQVQSGYGGIQMVTVDTVTPEYMYDLMQDVGLTLVTGDQFNYPNADGSTIADDGGWNFLTLPKTFQYYEAASGKWYQLTMNASGLVVAPILSSTKALSGVIDQSFSKTLTISGGDPATSWLITGGSDQAEYSLNNSGVLTRDVPNPLEESEVITVTASNAGGTSNTQTVTITYSQPSEGERKINSINLSFNQNRNIKMATDTSPIRAGQSVNPSDTVDLPEAVRALYIGVAGDLVIETIDGSELTFVGVTAGSVYPFKAKKVKAATSAASIVAIW